MTFSSRLIWTVYMNFRSLVNKQCSLTINLFICILKCISYTNIEPIHVSVFTEKEGGGEGVHHL